MPLNPNQIKSLQRGTYKDGDGLYLLVKEGRHGALARIWSYRFTAPDGQRSALEFAKFGERDGDDRMTLSTARDTARDYRLNLKRHGVDPRVKKHAAAAGGITLKAYAEQTYPGWCVGKNPDEIKAWARSIGDLESLQGMHPNDIDNEHVIAALKPIWWEKPITADRTRQRLEKLLDAARVEKIRTKLENPAAWRGNLKLVLPSPRKLNKKKGHASVPYAKAPALMSALRYEPGNSARCVEVGMLTCTRSQEVRWMEWDELDLDDKKTWLIPGWKMKIKNDTEEGKSHLVPLSDQAIEIIKSMLPKAGKYVFPSDAEQITDHQAFLPNALTGAIARTGIKSTMHGLRTTFRNWGADNREHNFRREVLEFCLSHRVGDEAELSYWTSEMLDRRREVMDAWADYIKPRKAVEAPKKGKKPSLRLVA
jgi:integrase